MTLVGINKNIAVQKLRDRMELLIDTMQDSIRKVVNDNNSDFNLVANEVSSVLIESIMDGTLNTQITALFSAYNLVGATANDNYALNKELFYFGNDQTFITNTPDITSAQMYLDLCIQAIAVFYGFETASQITYGSEDELQTVIDELDSAFDGVRNSTKINRDTRTALINQRTSTYEYFTTLNLATVTTINVIQSPARVIAYRNYGSSDNTDLIISLNRKSNTPFIEGAISVLRNEPSITTS